MDDKSHLDYVLQEPYCLCLILDYDEALCRLCGKKIMDHDANEIEFCVERGATSIEVPDSEA